MRSSSCNATIIMPPMWHIREPWTAPAYICEALRSKGYRVQFLDYNIDLYRLCEQAGFSHLWEEGTFFHTWMNGDMDYLVDIPDLSEITSEIVGISVTQTSRSTSIALAKKIREAYPGKKIIFGGHPYFFHKEVDQVPREYVDAICKGEGEHTICELLEKGFERIAEVPGLYIPDNEGWRLTAERPVEKNLDIIPWPRFEDINLDLYGKHFLPIMGARGCVGRCIFCNDRYRTPGYRTRSAVHQVDELEFLSQQFDVKHFPYNDPLMNGNVEVLSSKADELLRRNVKVQYGGNMMVRPDMPEDLFFKLRKSGLAIALIGVESGCATTLQHMRKRHTPEMAGTFIRNCHNSGIKTELNFILGFPTETEEHFKETCDFIRQYREYIDAIISIVPLQIQASDLFDQRNAFNIEIEDPSVYDSWHLRDGSNTFEIRWKRVTEFRQLADELGLLEDHVMCDGADGGDRYVPTREQFYFRLAQRLKSIDRDATKARLLSQDGLDRLASTLEKRSLLALSLVLAGKTLTNIKERGFRATLRRGREWATIKYRSILNKWF